jgi:predicted DNA-binding protein (MmcQ/YjbR family)
MRIDNSTGKGTSSMDKYSSKVYRVHMELGGKLLNSLKIKTQFFERLQSVGVVDGAAHTQRMMWRITEAPWSVAKNFETVHYGKIRLKCITRLYNRFFLGYAIF